MKILVMGTPQSWPLSHPQSQELWGLKDGLALSGEGEGEEEEMAAEALWNTFPEVLLH